MSSRFLSLALLLTALAAPADAWAYLDPGTGSYLFQLAVAGLLASLMTLKIYYQRIKDWVRGRREPAAPDSAGAAPRDPST